MIGPYVFITTEAFSESKDNPQGVHSGHSGDIEICSNVRIGAHSNILPGVKLELVHLRELEVLLHKMFQVSQ